MNQSEDPYHDHKIYHKGIGNVVSKTGKVGGVIPLCRYLPEHADPNPPPLKTVNLKRELWTLRDEAVTCKACLKRIEQDKANKAKPP